MILTEHFQNIWSKLFSQTWLIQDSNSPKPLGLRSYKPLGISPIFQPVTSFFILIRNRNDWQHEMKKLLTYLQVMDSSMYD